VPFPRGELAIPKGGTCHSRPSSSPFTNEEQAVCDNCDNCDSLFFTPKGIEKGIEIKRIADIMINNNIIIDNIYFFIYSTIFIFYLFS
jgi:hypothetical protein